MSVNKLGGALRGGHWPTLLGAWLHLTVSFMVWLLFGALAVAIGAELQLSATQRSVLVALPLLGGAVLRIIAGWACDWYGAKWTGLLVLGLQLIAVSWAVARWNQLWRSARHRSFARRGGSELCGRHAGRQSGLSCGPSGPGLGIGRLGQYRDSLDPLPGSPMGICTRVAWRLRANASPSGADYRFIRHSSAARASCSLDSRWRVVAGGNRDDACSFGVLALSDVWHHVRGLCGTDEFSSPAPA